MFKIQLICIITLVNKNNLNKIIKNNKIYNSLFSFDSKEKEAEYKFFYFSSKLGQTKTVILLTSILYFALGILDLLYSNIEFCVYIPIKLFIVISGFLLVYTKILTIEKVNSLVHLFYIFALIGILLQMYFSTDKLFFLFYSVGFISVMSVSIILSSVKLLNTIISSIILSSIYLFALHFKIDSYQLYGYIFLIFTVFAVAMLAALLNEISHRENFMLIKQIEKTTNEKIADEIEINKASIQKLQSLNQNNTELRKTIKELMQKEKSLNTILNNKTYDSDTKLKVIIAALNDFNVYTDGINKEIEQTNIDITKKLDELKENIEIKENFEINKKQFDLNQMLNDIELIFKFSVENRSFNITNSTNTSREIKTDQAKLKQIFVSLVNHLFNIGANKIDCSYYIDDDKNIIFTFNSDRYINDKLDVNKLLVPMYLANLGGKIMDNANENNTIIFKIPAKQSEIIINTDNSLNFDNKSVLIIDDDKENLSYLEFVIKSSKAKIYKASNGVEALDIFKENNNELQIVIMDINMPGLNGNEAARFMKEINPSVPILLVTAYSFYNNKLLNADKVLIKPFSPKVLIENISELVN